MLFLCCSHTGVSSITKMHKVFFFFSSSIAQLCIALWCSIPPTVYRTLLLRVFSRPRTSRSLWDPWTGYRKSLSMDYAIRIPVSLCLKESILFRIRSHDKHTIQWYCVASVWHLSKNLQAIESGCYQYLTFSWPYLFLSLDLLVVRMVAVCVKVSVQPCSSLMSWTSWENQSEWHNGNLLWALHWSLIDADITRIHELPSAVLTTLAYV